MFHEINIRGAVFSPALFCAPLAEVTHSAFRRLVAEFGGCGALFTEMLSGREVLREDLANSPYTKRRPVEKKVFYQLMFRPDDPVERIIGKLAQINPDGIDINLACYAPVIRQIEAGASLFENPVALASVLQAARRSWSGPLTVKIRLGSSTHGAEDRFVERLKIIEEAGIDAITLHTRFFEDKFKRRARHELFRWAVSLTRLPIIANGDIAGPKTVRDNPHLFESIAGIMIGRMAVARPWIFAAWNEPMEIDVPAVWWKMFQYICEDFTDPKDAMERIELFTSYYARNFHFGHTFHMGIHNAKSLDAMRARAEQFFSTPQAVFDEPNLMGL